MFKKIEDFFMNQLAGKLISRGAVIAAGGIAAYASSAPAQALLGKAAFIASIFGVPLPPIHVNEIALATALATGANWLFEYFKARRMANPESVTVQTDKTKL